MSSPILAFATVFLSLTLGVHPIEVLVGDEVASVEIRLDDQLVTTLSRPEWKGEVDFGFVLEPHKLEAVAFDVEGEERARSTQWVNLPSPIADVGVVIDRDAEGRAIAKLSWANLMGSAPESVRVSFDGRLLEVLDPRSIVLPEHDLEQLHFLRAELDFALNVSAVTEVTFGGAYGDQLNTELTALPILVDDGAAIPEPGAMQDWFLSGDRPATVAAVDDGPAEVVLIRDEGVQPVLERVITGRSIRRPSESFRRGTVYTGRYDLRLKKDQHLAFFWPFMVKGEAELWTFPSAFGWMSPREAGVGWWLTQVPPPPSPEDGQLLADAVAVAGMNSLTRNRRRAVVLVLGKEPDDHSRLSPAAVRAYLERLRVPLFVWSPYPQSNPSWGPVTDISTPGKLRAAVSELADSVSRQRIVWFEGRHLPNELHLSERATGISLPI